MINLSPSQLRLAADLQDQIAALKAELAALFGGTAPAPVEAPATVEAAQAAEPIQAEEPAKPGQRTMSPARKAALRAAQALRWAKVNAAKGKSAPQTATSAKGTRGKSVEGVTGLVLKKISDEEIKAFIGAERGLKDLVKKYGQLISKRLVDMKQADLVSVRNDGPKKIWSVA